MKGFIAVLLYKEFHFGVRLSIQNFISHEILDLYHYMNLLNKGMSIFQKHHVQCDALEAILFGNNSN